MSPVPVSRVGSDELTEKASAAKLASHVLAGASTDQKNRALLAIARALRGHEPRILSANARDCERAQSTSVDLDRLRLDSSRVSAMARDVEVVAGLPDPIGDNATSPPDSWGPYELVAIIPKNSLTSAIDLTIPGYHYVWEDRQVNPGFSYWYYVAAYKEGTYTGPDGETTTRIETHNTNRNGATGLWQLTYPFATNNVNFGKSATTDAAASAAGLKNIGAVQVVYSALAPAGSVATVGVRPNPYKRAALHDNRANVYDHKLLFYNLPPVCKITIVDVSGLVIDVINFSSTDANRGSTFWDMFSKDGLEVASGVYLYVVESPTGDQKVGQFSILR